MLAVTANPQTKAYGTADPSLTRGVTGLVDTTVDGVAIDDSAISVLTGNLIRAQAGKLAGEQAGPYAITQGTLSANSDYAIAFTGSTMMITPAVLTVTANPQTKAYGTADPSLTYGVTGLVNTTVDGVAIEDPAASALTGSLTRAQAATPAGEQAGVYAITQGTLAADSSYTIAFTGSMLTITRAPLTVTANLLTKVYGTNDPGLTDGVTGLVNTTVDGVAIDDPAASALTGSLTRAQAGTLAGEQTGVYAITQGTLAADSNYTIAFTGSTLTIAPASLAVTANPQTKVYGTNDPDLTDGVTGLVDTTVDGVAIDDTATTAVSGHLARAAGETVSGGPYAITQGTLAASNYKIDFTGNTLTVTPATLTIAADSETKFFGSADPTLAYTSSGFKFPDTAATVLFGSLARGRRDSLGQSLLDRPGNSHGQQQLRDPLHRQLREYHSGHARNDRQRTGRELHRRANRGNGHGERCRWSSGPEPGRCHAEFDVLRRIGHFGNGTGLDGTFSRRDLYRRGVLPRQRRLCGEPVAAHDLRDHPDRHHDRARVFINHGRLRPVHHLRGGVELRLPGAPRDGHVFRRRQSTDHRRNQRFRPGRDERRQPGRGFACDHGDV